MTFCLQPRHAHHCCSAFIQWLALANLRKAFSCFKVTLGSFLTSQTVTSLGLRVIMGRLAVILNFLQLFTICKIVEFKPFTGLLVNLFQSDVYQPIPKSSEISLVCAMTHFYKCVVKTLFDSVI